MKVLVERDILLERSGSEGGGSVEFLVDVWWRVSSPHWGYLFFFHGFKAFKDWGVWWVVARRFAEAGWITIVPSFSHNGTLPRAPRAFVALERFRRWTFSEDLRDVERLIEWLEEKTFVVDVRPESGRFVFVGHSRGGLVALQSARKWQDRVLAVVTWGSPHQPFSTFSEEELKRWQSEGTVWIENRRTGERLPYDWVVYEDFLKHRAEQDPALFGKTLNVPVLIVHGLADETVPVGHAHRLKGYFPRAELRIVEGAGHTFGGRHPWEEETLPSHLEEVVTRTLAFLSEHTEVHGK